MAILDGRGHWALDRGGELEHAPLSGLDKRDGRAFLIGTSASDDTHPFSRWIDDPAPGSCVREHRPAPGLPADDPESPLRRPDRRGGGFRPRRGARRAHRGSTPDESESGMVLNSGGLNRRIQIRRFVETGRDSLKASADECQDHGPAIFTLRRDVSDAEQLSAAIWDNLLVTRFIIRATAFGRGIRRSDQIVHEGITFEVDGIKEVSGTRRFLEITAKSGNAA